MSMSNPALRTQRPPCVFRVGFAVLALALAMFALATESSAQTTAGDWVSSAVRKILKNDLDGALADTEMALRLDANLATAYCLRGQIRSSKGQLDGAIEDFDKSIALDPKLPLAYIERATAKSLKRDVDGAIADATRAIELVPNLPKPYLVRGVARSEKGDFDGAIADLSSAIARDSRNVNYYVSRGRANAAKGDAEAAKADLVVAGKIAVEIGGGIPSGSPSADTLPEFRTLPASADRGKPNGRSDSSAPFNRAILPISVDSRYGYTKENPILVGPISRGSGRDSLFLNSLRGPNGEPVEYERVGTCCAFKTANSPMGTGEGLVDIYRVRVDGSNVVRYLFVNFYDPGKVKIPVGFVQRVEPAVGAVAAAR